MIKLERTSVMNFENAMRGARNPLDSWDRYDSYTDEDGNFIFGENDLKLAKKLCHAGSDHRKFIRQVFISVDITAPIYWWKEYDTYKVGTVANSTSTMHKIHSRPFRLSDFSTDHMVPAAMVHMESLLLALENIRQDYINTNDKDLWYSIIQLLPESYNQMRTCTFSYENAAAMYKARKTINLKNGIYFVTGYAACHILKNCFWMIYKFPGYQAIPN